ncbi:MAG: hypothetical protein NVS1B14_06890 [Vulcanimicrobiaceae bacterium]
MKPPLVRASGQRSLLADLFIFIRETNPLALEFELIFARAIAAGALLVFVRFLERQIARIISVQPTSLPE